MGSQYHDSPRENRKANRTRRQPPKQLLGRSLGKSNGHDQHRAERLKEEELHPPETQSEGDVRLRIRKIGRRDARIIFDVFHVNFDATQAHLYG